MTCPGAVSQSTWPRIRSKTLTCAQLTGSCEMPASPLHGLRSERTSTLVFGLRETSCFVQVAYIVRRESLRRVHNGTGQWQNFVRRLLNLINEFNCTISSLRVWFFIARLSTQKS